MDSSDLGVTLRCHLVHSPMAGCTQTLLARWLKAFLDEAWLRNTPFVVRRINTGCRLMTFPAQGWSTMWRANAGFYLFLASSVSDSL